MKPKTLKTISNIFTLLFICFLVWYFYNNQEALNDLKAVPFWAFAGLMVSKTIRIFVSGLFTRFTLRSFGKDISIRQTNYLSLLSGIGNFFGPILGGAGIRAVYLKKNYDFNYSHFIATLYAYYVISFLTNSLFGTLMIGYYLLSRGGNFNSYFILGIFLAIFILCLALLVLPNKYIVKLYNIKIIPVRIKKISKLAHEGWEEMRKDRKLLKDLSILNFLTLIISAFTTYILFDLFVPEYTVMSILFYTILSTLALLINVTPGGIGIKEALYVFSATILAVTPEQILQMSVVDRISTFLLLGVLFIISKITNLATKTMGNKKQHL